MIKCELPMIKEQGTHSKCERPPTMMFGPLFLFMGKGAQ